MYFEQFLLLYFEIGKRWPDSRTMKKKKKSAPMSNAKAFMREMQLFEKAEFKTEENKKHRALAQSLLSPSHIASTVFPLSEDPFSSKN